MALFALGCYMYLNRVLIRFSQPACIVNRICRGCTIREAPGCKFNRTILLIGIFVAMAAMLPFFAPTEALLADTSKYILPFESLNRWYDETLIPWLAEIYPEYITLSLGMNCAKTLLPDDPSNFQAGDCIYWFQVGRRQRQAALLHLQ